MALALRQGREYHGREILIERPDRSRRLGMAYAHPLRTDQGAIIGAVNLVVDITAPNDPLANLKNTGRRVSGYSDATLAMIEVAVSALAGMTWATSAFS